MVGVLAPDRGFVEAFVAVDPVFVAEVAVAAVLVVVLDAASPLAAVVGYINFEEASTNDDEGDQEIPIPP